LGPRILRVDDDSGARLAVQAILECEQIVLSSLNVLDKAGT